MHEVIDRGQGHSDHQIADRQVVAENPSPDKVDRRVAGRRIPRIIRHHDIGGVGGAFQFLEKPGEGGFAVGAIQKIGGEIVLFCVAVNDVSVFVDQQNIVIALRAGGFHKKRMPLQMQKIVMGIVF